MPNNPHKLSPALFWLPIFPLPCDPLTTGWRRLPRPEIKSGFVANMLRRRTEGAFSKELNKGPRPRIIGAQDPGDESVVCKVQWVNDYTPEIRFIPDVLKDVERNVDLVQTRLAREERLAKGGGLSQIIAAGDLDFVGARSIVSVAGASEESSLKDRMYKASAGTHLILILILLQHKSLKPSAYPHPVSNPSLSPHTLSLILASVLTLTCTLQPRP